MQPSTQISKRATIVALIFALSSLLSSGRLIVETPSPGHLKPDEIGKRSDQRFAALKTALPQRGIIGYVGDSGEFAVVDHYLAQYALAPVVVEHSSNHSLVVGNYRSLEPGTSLPANFQIVKDFGNGVFLFSNKDAR